MSDPRDSYPDLALIQAVGGWATVDLVTHPPDPERLSTELGRYHRNRQILAQLFVVERDRGIKEAITNTAAQLGISDRVHVQLLADNGIDGA